MNAYALIESFGSSSQNKTLTPFWCRGFFFGAHIDDSRSPSAQALSLPGAVMVGGGGRSVFLEDDAASADRDLVAFHGFTMDDDIAGATDFRRRHVIGMGVDVARARYVQID